MNGDWDVRFVVYESCSKVNNKPSNVYNYFFPIALVEVFELFSVKDLEGTYISFNDMLSH